MAEVDTAVIASPVPGVLASEAGIGPIAEELFLIVCTAAVVAVV